MTDPGKADLDLEKIRGRLRLMLSELCVDPSDWLGDFSEKFTAHFDDEGWIVLASQLADELAEAREQRDKTDQIRDRLLVQARIWALEAKTQQATVNEVGSAIGGMADWQPIADAVRALQSRLDDQLERNGYLQACIDEHKASFSQLRSRLDEVVRERDELVEAARQANRALQEAINGDVAACGRTTVDAEYRLRTTLDKMKP